MTHVTCRLTVRNRDQHQLRNPTLGNRVWAIFFIRVLRYVSYRPVQSSSYLKNTYVFNALYFSVRKQQQNTLCCTNIVVLILQSCHHCASHDQAKFPRITCLGASTVPPPFCNVCGHDYAFCCSY